MLNLVRQLQYANSFLKCCREYKVLLHVNRNLATVNPIQRKNPVSKIEVARQPVPNLEHTLNKYLKTVQPFLSSDEYKVTEALIKDFKQDGGVGQKLQSYLQERAKKSENWLAEWWLNTAYLEYRSPVVVWSSPGLVYPLRTFNSMADQLTYAANTILAALSYKQLIDDNKIPQEMAGQEPLDMSQYKKIFGTSRIPRPKKDELSFSRNSSHIIIMHNNNFFELNVLHDDQSTLSVEDVYDNLLTIVESSMDKGAPVGILSSEDRDTWAHCYQILEQIPENKDILRKIQSSLFVLSLDSVCDETKVSSQTKAALQTIHGGGSQCNSGNRWFDKTIQFIVNRGGEVGLTYEHSPAEGQPIAVMTDYIVDFVENKYEVPDTSTTRNFPMRIKKLNFVVPKELNTYIDKAKQKIDELIKDLEMNCFTYQNYGKSFIKSHKYSPDSYIQMAQQYAFYRLHNVPGAHYESASARRFLNGRTETIRSCSTESVQFAQTMLSKSASANEKLSALAKAIAEHKNYAVEAMKGLGVDRHLLGLKLAAKELGIEVPKLFKDAGYMRSSHMRISTSQVAAKCDAFMCYGPLVQNGYACCYNPREENMNFAISAFRSGEETNALLFRQSMEYSLDDMKNLLTVSE